MESGRCKKSGKISIKLPNLEIGEYDGSYLNWSSIRDKFEAAIDSREDLTDVQTLTYYKSYQVGEEKMRSLISRLIRRIAQKQWKF